MNDDQLDGLAMSIGILAQASDELEEMADEADDAARNDEDTEITMSGQVFIAMYNCHQVFFEMLLEAGLISEDDLEMRINRIIGTDRLN